MAAEGWAKLSILATYGEAETIDDLLDVAEDCTAHELKMYSAMAIDPDGQTVVLHLDSEQYALLEQALLAEGARLELKDVGAILDSRYLNRDSALGEGSVCSIR